MNSSPWMIVTGDFGTSGGMDRANYALAHYLLRNGLKVHLVAFTVCDDLRAHANAIIYPVAKPLGSYGLGFPLLARKARQVANIVASHQGRVIVNGGTLAFADVNWVHYVHAAYKPEIAASPWRAFIRKRQHNRFLAEEAAAFNRARLLITNSLVTSNHLQSLLNVPASKTRCVYLAADPNVFFPVSSEIKTEIRKSLGIDADRPVGLFVGALGDRRKGLDVLLKAWKRMGDQRREPAPLLLVAGAGAEAGSLRQQSEFSGLGEAVKFVSFTRKIAQLYQAADVLISPTRYEAYGLAIHEAICCGTPAIISANAGIAERYPPELADWLLPDPEDAADLAHRLQQFFSNVEQSRQRVNAFSESLRRHSWDDMAREMVRTIDPSLAAQIESGLATKPRPDIITNQT